MLVTKLPQRLKMARKPTRNAMSVAPSATLHATNVHSATVLYVFNPVCHSFGKRVCTPVPFKPQTVTGSNQYSACRGEQYVMLVVEVPLLLARSPEQ